MEYITLAKASELCEYSQEYLSLRARGKKFKAVKLGRNWYTKKKWLEEYLKANNKDFTQTNKFLVKQSADRKLSFKEFYEKHTPKFSAKFAYGLIALLLVANIATFSFGAAGGKISVSNRLYGGAIASFAQRSSEKAEIEARGVGNDICKLSLYLREKARFARMACGSAGKILHHSFQGMEAIFEDSANSIKMAGENFLKFPKENKNASVKK